MTAVAFGFSAASGLRSHPQIRYQDRRRYLLLIADELDQCAEVGDGNVSRAIAHAVRTIRRNPDPR
jgi:hypothetical protein